MGRNDAAIALMEKINAKHGAGAVMTAAEMHIPKRFYSGSLVQDVALNGGFAANHWSEVYGVENHGKTAITLKMLAYNQAQDPEFHTLWVASEHYDVDQAEALGVDTKRVDVLSTQDMAFAYDTLLEYMKERAADLFVLDSYPALIPPDEDAKDMDEYTRAEGAKMTNKFFRKAGKAGLRDPDDPEDRPWLGIFINQPRDSMKTVWTPSGTIPLDTTPGGRGKNFAFYTRLMVARAEWLEVGPPKGKKTKVGQVIRTRAIKHKGGPPERVASMDFYFTDHGEFRRGDYDIPKDILTAAVLMGTVSKAGGWYRYGGDLLGNGLQAVLTAVKEDDTLRARIEADTREAVHNPRDKRTWSEEDVESAATATKTVRRRRRKSSDEDAED
jgi:recombination protein RecA